MKKNQSKFLSFLLLSAIFSGTVFFKLLTDNSITDGPYVLYQNGKVYAKYVVQQADGTLQVKCDSVAESWKDKLTLQVNTDEAGKTFTVKLKEKITDEKAEYRKVSKQFVISDLEGNFKAFRKLLLAGGVIDTDFNWTFGTGHLVLVGDLFDRGSHVAEVLWLIYSLEDKAKAAGGYVHYVLGNHEIMNLNGDLRYLNEKYIKSAIALHENYVNLYGENSELGRWLRSKNIVEKVGNVLYAHAGISQILNEIDINASDINKTARPWYADSTENYKTELQELLMHEWGPLWYRGYYKGNPKASIAQIDSSLAKFDVRHIITGHTIIADTISVLYDGKLFDTDVHHAKGKSEAIFIEDGKFFRILPTGEKKLLHSR